MTEMAERWGISVGTIRNWDARSCMPRYVQEMTAELYQAISDANNARRRRRRGFRRPTRRGYHHDDY